MHNTIILSYSNTYYKPVLFFRGGGVDLEVSFLRLPFIRDCE